MNTKMFQKGDVIFRQGDAAACMYDIVWGRVGIYLDYGTPQERKLAELGADEYFGEMGMIDRLPRSATAVALTNRTRLQEITEDGLEELFRERPGKVLLIMQHLSKRLRRLTTDYLEACRTALDIERIEEGQEKPDEKTVQEVKERAEYYFELRLYGYNIHI